jgi:thioredoxin reductase (NADPH)
MTDVEVDVLVVGAGPVGLYAAYYAGFRELRTAVMDSLPEPGGQVAALYPEKLIHDVAGLVAIKGRDLVAGLLAQADQFGPTYLLGEVAEKLERLPDGRLAVLSSGGTQVSARAIVIAGGIGNFTPRPLPGGAAFEGRGLAYFVRDPAELDGADVVIVGGGDSAVDWAVALSDVARSVKVVHRRDAFRAHEHSVSRMRATDAEILTPYVVSRVLGTERVTGLEVTDVASRQTRELACDSVVAALGFTANLGAIEDWGLEISNRCIAVDSRMRTAVPGVYAAGDITDYPGKVRLIAVGFGEAATAINNAAVAINPAVELFPGHSSDA